jgi:hypothetical protein
LLPPLPNDLQNHVNDYDIGAFADPAALEGEAFFHPSLLGSPSDRSVFEMLMQECDFQECWLNTGMKFSRNICLGTDDVLENSCVWRAIVQRLSDFFGVKVVRTLANLYRDGNDWCNLHSDQYNQVDRGYKIDLTIGCSFGDERKLIWVEKANERHRIELPQRNGDCFAFSDHINNTWRHMVPRAGSGTGPRISIIVWCCRQKEEAVQSGKQPLGRFPHMYYHNPKGKGNDYEAGASRGRGKGHGKGKKK